MKLFICDDNLDFADKLKSDILSIKSDVDVTIFPTISSLLFTLEDTGKSIDGIFLDIKNSDGNGIDAASKIKKRFPLIKLVFVTGYGDEYSQDIFNCPVGFEPIAFLVKPVKENYLKIALEKIQSAATPNERYIPVTYNRTTTFLNEKDIVFISSDKRKINIYTADKSYTYYDKLETVISKLGNNFCRCHRSYIVNFDFIKTTENWNALTMNNNTVIPVGKSYLDNLKRRLIEYKASNQKEKLL